MTLDLWTDLTSHLHQISLQWKWLSRLIFCMNKGQTNLRLGSSHLNHLGLICEWPQKQTLIVRNNRFSLSLNFIQCIAMVKARIIKYFNRRLTCPSMSFSLFNTILSLFTFFRLSTVKICNTLADMFVWRYLDRFQLALYRISWLPRAATACVTRSRF